MSQTEKMNWKFDEFTHLAVDFSDKEQVATYDSRQYTNFQEERELVAKLGINAKSTVIEFGPGTGGFSIAASEVCRKIYAVDISQAMLDFSKEQAEKRDIRNIEFHRSGFLNYEHRADPVDFIVTKFALHHLPDFWKVIALRRMYKMLKAGGIFYLEDAIFSFAPDSYEKKLEAWVSRADKIESFSRKDFEGHVRDEFSTFNWILETIFEKTGFKVIDKHFRSTEYGTYKCIKQ